MRVAILGASRGLGAAVFRELNSRPEVDSLFISSRKLKLLEQLQSNSQKHTIVQVADFTKQEDHFFKNLEAFSPTHIYVIAGGGPYGEFSKKGIKDHEWALSLGLLFPMKVAHWALNFTGSIEQVLFVGSSIAEVQPDPMAASYAAAKHGLKGFVSSLVKENPSIDFRLFSPGYLDTDMLPINAMARQRAKLGEVSICDVSDAAKSLIEFSVNSRSPFHCQK